MMIPFPPKLIAARRCANWRTRARVRVGSLRFARFGFPLAGARARVEASTLSTLARFGPWRRRLMRDVAGELVLQSQFLFLEAVEKVFVGVSAMLFFFDQ